MNEKIRAFFGMDDKIVRGGGRSQESEVRVTKDDREFA
jgi:hypothetical protein